MLKHDRYKNGRHYKFKATFAGNHQIHYRQQAVQAECNTGLRHCRHKALYMLTHYRYRTEGITDITQGRYIKGKEGRGL